MRKLWPILILCLVSGCAPLVAPQQPVSQSPEPKTFSGRISQDAVWEGEILIEGDILVPAGTSLRILPGTSLRIREAESTRIDPEYLSSATEILVRGRLLVEGRSDAPVRFLPQGSAEAGEPAWAGIIFDRSGSGTLRFAVIESAEAGVYILGSSPGILNSVFRGCRYGILVQGRSAALISQNLIEGGEGGIFLWRGVKAHLLGNLIQNNGEEGLFIDAESRPELRDNQLTGNDIGMAVSDLSLAQGQVLKDNRRNLVVLPGGDKP